MDHIKFPNNKHRSGSALILVVVLTALLAVIGTMFLLSSRVESMSTSGIEEEKALESAVDDIIAKISATLTNDVPGVSGQEYYDYPGQKDKWLASIEPYKDGTEYIWPQITDLTGVLQDQNDINMKFATQNVKVDPPGTRKVILEYPEIILNATGSWLEKGNNDDGNGLPWQTYRGQLADADGDGIADSKWIKLTDVSTGKGKDIYAAIRIIDNGGMINVNTAYGFAPDSTIKNHVDGSTQSSIDLAALARSGDSMGDGDTNDLNRVRSNDTNANVYDPNYQKNVLRRIESPDDPDYQPFDISDDLDLRSRFCVSSKNKGRLKTVWENTLDIRNKTFDSSSGDGLSDWEEEVCREILKANYDRRHMLTCWNMDRIINPDGIKKVDGKFKDCEMFGINGRLDNIGNYDQNYYKDFNNRQQLFKAIKAALDSTGTAVDMGEKAAQITANLIDYIDSDLKMTVINPYDMNSTLPTDKFYGFEGPCVYISEIAVMCEADPAYPTDPTKRLYSYAIELYNPYAADNDAINDADVLGDNWYLRIAGSDILINWADTGKFYVMYNDNVPPLTSSISGKIMGGSSGSYPTMSFSGGNEISLVRNAGDPNEKKVDSISVPANLFNGLIGETRSIERDTSPHKCIKNLWSSTSKLTDTLGIINNILAIKNNDGTEIFPMQAHPANKELDCIGDIGNIFEADAYQISVKPQINFDVTEDTVRVNLANPIYQNLFQYLTVFDPNNDNIDNDGDGNKDSLDQDGPEWKIPGRININTAPWFVLAQLPWVSKERSGAINYELSKAIVAYRDKIKIDSVDYSGDHGRFAKLNVIAGMPAIIQDEIREEPGFASIGELNFVVDNNTADLYSMWRYGLDLTDLVDYPDVIKIDTNGDGIPEAIDGVADDFEERDVIFARISNLVTVRSDVFTAYMLVRVGVDGPQQRAIAVFDRSNVYPKPGGGSTGKVKIRAFQMVSGIR